MAVKGPSVIHQGAAVVRPSGSSTARDYSREGGIAPCGALARPPPAEGRTHRKVSQAGGAGHGTLGTAGAGRERRKERGQQPAARTRHPGGWWVGAAPPGVLRIPRRGGTTHSTGCCTVTERRGDTRPYRAAPGIATALLPRPPQPLLPHCHSGS